MGRGDHEAVLTAAPRSAPVGERCGAPLRIARHGRGWRHRVQPLDDHGRADGMGAPWGNVPIYADVAKFFGKAHAFYSPTFMVAGPSSWNEDYWYAESDVFKDPKMQAWLPWQMLIPQTRRRMLRPATDYSFPLLARGLADIIAEGGYGTIGSHGQQHGLGSHWEVWMAASAMGPMGALEVGTIHGARFIGIETVS